MGTLHYTKHVRHHVRGGVDSSVQTSCCPSLGPEPYFVDPPCVGFFGRRNKKNATEGERERAELLAHTLNQETSFSL